MVRLSGGGRKAEFDRLNPTRIVPGIEFIAAPGKGQVTWSLVGDATFEGPTADQLTVRVTAGAPGQFTVRASFSASPACERTTTVTDPVSAVPSSWSRIKSLPHPN